MARGQVLCLYKFGHRAHMEELVSGGHVYMPPLSEFIRMEAGTPRSDEDEALAHVIAAEGGELSVEYNGQWVPVGTIGGPIRFSNPALQRVNVFCMHAFRSSHVESLVDPRNFDFGDTYVAFTDADEFVRRVRAKAARLKLNFQRALVEYVDPSVYRGDMGIFRKFSSYSFQSEFRLALLPGTGQPYSLRVGDISDITRIGPLAELNQRIRIEPKPTTGANGDAA